MENSSYNVIFTGRIREGFPAEAVIQAAAALFKCGEDTVRRMLSGKPVVFKKNLPRTAAENYVARLQKIGIACHLMPHTPGGEKSEPRAGTPAKSPAAPSAAAISPPAAPAPGSRRPTVAPDIPDAQEVPADALYDFMLYVGENADAYEGPFRALEDNGGRYKPQWHWPALLVTIPWLLHRKLYGTALFYLLALFALLHTIPLLALIPAFLLPPLTAHYLYYRVARRALRRTSGGGVLRERRLIKAGGRNNIPRTLVASIALVAPAWYAFLLLAPPLAIPGIAGTRAATAEQHREDTLAARKKASLATMMALQDLYTEQGTAAPETIEGLKNKLQLAESDVRDAWNHRLALEINGGAVTLRSAGADAMYRTADDIELEITRKR